MESPTVLIIGDLHENEQLFSYFLQREGFRVLTAETVQDGLEIYRQESVSVLLMDLRVGVRTFQLFFELDPSVKCCLISGGGYSKWDTPEDDGLTIVMRPFCLPDMAQALWSLVTQPDMIVYLDATPGFDSTLE